MVLKKKYIHRNQEKGQAVSQLTLDDDFNISDHKPDVVKVIQDKGEIRLEEVRVSDGHVWVKGTLEFAILYKSDQSQMRIASLTGSIPFQENLGMDQVTETDTVKIHTQNRGSFHRDHQFQKIKYPCTGISAGICGDDRR